MFPSLELNPTDANPVELLILWKSFESRVPLAASVDSRAIQFFLNDFEIMETNCSSVRHSELPEPLSWKSLFQIVSNLALVRQSQSDSWPPPPPPPPPPTYW